MGLNTHPWFLIEKTMGEKSTNTQTDVLSGIPKSAICVRKLDDSLNSAIHITYRSLLRSSSMHKPRDPLLKVVFTIFCLVLVIFNFFMSLIMLVIYSLLIKSNIITKYYKIIHNGIKFSLIKEKTILNDNDPSAGSPTDTLLRLLLPLNRQV